MTFNPSSLKLSAKAALLLLLFAGFLVGCGGDDDSGSAEDFSPEALHDGGSKTWNLAEFRSISVYQGDTVVDRTFNDVCMNDDEWIFRDDNTVDMNVGDVACPDTLMDNENVSGTYAYVEETQKMTGVWNTSDGQNAFDWDVTELTESRMKLVNSETDGDWVYWEEFTFQKK